MLQGNRVVSMISTVEPIARDIARVYFNIPIFVDTFSTRISGRGVTAELHAFPHSQVGQRTFFSRPKKSLAVKRRKRRVGGKPSTCVASKDEWKWPIPVLLNESVAGAKRKAEGTRHAVVVIFAWPLVNPGFSRATARKGVIISSWWLVVFDASLYSRLEEPRGNFLTLARNVSHGVGDKMKKKKKKKKKRKRNEMTKNRGK